MTMMTNYNLSGGSGTTGSLADDDLGANSGTTFDGSGESANAANAPAQAAAAAQQAATAPTTPTTSTAMTTTAPTDTTTPPAATTPATTPAVTATPTPATATATAVTPATAGISPAATAFIVIGALLVGGIAVYMMTGGVKPGARKNPISRKVNVKRGARRARKRRSRS